MQSIFRITLACLFAVVLTTAAVAQPVPKNPNILRLAEAGNAWAQTRLGFMLATGQGLPQNYAEAAYWYRRAAEQGNTDAQYLLAGCYDLGKGVPIDWVQSYKWYNLSAARTRAGDEREHRARMRDAIASKLSATEFSVAQRLAIAWYPKPEVRLARQVTISYK